MDSVGRHPSWHVRCANGAEDGRWRKQACRGLILSAVDPVALIAIVTPLCVSIIGGALAMAWRLGGLERTVKDLVSDVGDMKVQMDKIDAKSDAAASAATAAAAAATVANIRPVGARTRSTD